jgi:predicted MPP superfamily phosphohydrolase
VPCPGDRDPHTWSESLTEANKGKTFTAAITFMIKFSFQKIDYIYMTGDIVDHGVWDTSISKNTESIKKLLTALKMEFPNTPVYPVLGNHESSPPNM